MSLYKFFNQAVMGVAMTASIATAANALEIAKVPEGSMCQVLESEVMARTSHNLSHTDRLYDFDLGVVMFINRFNSIDPPMTAVSVSDLLQSGNKKYKEMQKYLSSACKAKLGIK